MASPFPVQTAESFDAAMGELGLSASERKVYRYLLEAGPSTCSAIARGTGNSRGRMYETTRRLAAKGFAREEPVRPIRYAPMPLGEVAAHAAARLYRQTAALRQLSEMLKRLGVAEEARPPPMVHAGDLRLLHGRRACTEEVHRLLAAARGRFLLAGGGRFARRLRASERLLQELRAAVARGVHVVVVLPSDPGLEEDRADLEERLGPGVVRDGPAFPGPLVSAVSDRTALEFVSQPDDEALGRGRDLGTRIESQVHADAAWFRLASQPPPASSAGPVPVAGGAPQAQAGIPA